MDNNLLSLPLYGNTKLCAAWWITSGLDQESASGLCRSTGEHGGGWWSRGCMSEEARQSSGPFMTTLSNKTFRKVYCRHQVVDHRGAANLTITNDVTRRSRNDRKAL